MYAAVRSPVLKRAVPAARYASDIAAAARFRAANPMASARFSVQRLMC